VHKKCRNFSGIAGIRTLHAEQTPEHSVTQRAFAPTNEMKWFGLLADIAMAPQ
jgi:hypothetical protein